MQGGGGGQEDGRIKGIKKKSQRGHVCKIFLFFFTFIDLRVGNIFLI